MFKCVDGLPGSGKSYFATYQIKSQSEDYHKVLTNIDSFKFYDNVSALDFNGLKSILQDCKDLYDLDQEDIVLRQILLDNDLISKDKPLLIVIDEAHNFFDKKDDLLTWFITYHRHLYIDVYLITQTYSLLHYSYHKLIQEYIHALPQDRQLFGGKFKYQKHIAVPYNKQLTHAGDEYLRLDKSVFALYQSGDSVRSKSVVRKYLYYTIAFIFFAVLAFYYMIDYFFISSGSSTTDSKVTTEQRKVTDFNATTLQNPVFEFQDLTYLKLTCNIKKCSNFKKNIHFDFDLLQALIDNSGSKLLKVEKIYKNSSSVVLMASPTFFNFFQGVSNDKNNNNVISLF